MAPVLAQSVSNAVAKGQTRTCTATFTSPTTEKNLIVVTATAGGGGTTTVTGPAGFTLVRDRTVGNLQIVVWYREGAPTVNAVTVTVGADRSLQVRALEYSGVAQAGALDKVTVLTNTTAAPTTGTSGTTAQADELVVAAVANRYASTTQAGFAGGLTRLFESVSPASYGLFSSNADADRTRLTVHQLVASTLSSFSLSALLSSAREWVAILLTFRGGSSGPKRMTSTQAPPVLVTAGSGVLSAFGPLRSLLAGPVATAGTASSAKIGPSNYQYLLGGWGGLMIGDGTEYRVESHDGLEGWQIRTSDQDLPRGDGALRGVDLQSPRTVLLKLKVGGEQDHVERLMDALYRALVPRYDTDEELIWRHPGRPLRALRCRPTDLARELSWRETLVQHQAFALRAADPRHYSAFPRRVEIPVTPAGADQVTAVSVVNAGNANAYAVVTIVGPTSGPAVSRIELVNATADVTFDVATTIPARSVLVGDMQAQVTGAPRSAITLDGQSKYGAWQLPREAFYIAPDPVAIGGVNALYLRTVPAGAPVVCTVDYRDCWSG